MVAGRDLNEISIREFHYEQLPGSKRLRVQRETEAIRALLERTATNVIQIGLRLRLVRDALGPHSFQEWLRLEFQWSQSVASNFMRAAAAFAHIDCLVRFQPSALYLLSRRRIPEAARQEAVNRARSGELITKAQAEAIVIKHVHRELLDQRQDASALRRALRRAVQQARKLREDDPQPADEEMVQLIAELQVLLLEGHEPRG